MDRDRPAERSAEEEPMTEAQASILKSLAAQAFEPEAYRGSIGRAEADRRIAALEAKLRLLDEPPHTL